MNKRNDDDNDEVELRKLYSELHAEQQGPTDDELVELLLGELDDSDRQVVVDRMLQSPEASERYRILKDLHRETKRNARKPRRFAPFAVAATVILGIGIVLLRPIGDGTPPVRGGDSSASPSGYEELSEAPSNLQWHLTSARLPYSVSMFDESGTLLWQVDNLDAQTLTLSEVNRERLTAPGTFFWIVEDAGGTETGPYWFQIDAK